MKSKLIHRRTFLRGLAGGAAVGLALPPLEAMFTGRSALANPVENQPFFGLFFWANGTPWHAKHGPQQAAAGHPDLWTPSQTGPGFAPSPLLQPLDAICAFGDHGSRTPHGDPRVSTRRTRGWAHARFHGGYDR